MDFRRVSSLGLLKYKKKLMSFFLYLSRKNEINQENLPLYSQDLFRIYYHQKRLDRAEEELIKEKLVFK
jgi:hypothetical protein